MTVVIQETEKLGMLCYYKVLVLPFPLSSTMLL